jgi:hypothetical protein
LLSGTKGSLPTVGGLVTWPRYFLTYLSFPARPLLCALEALRWVVGGASMTTPGGAGTPRKACYNFLHVLGPPASLIGSQLSRTGLRPFVANRNICNFLWYGGVARGVAGEGLRSVGMSPIGPNQERVLYPARRSPFKGRGILRGVPDFIMLVSLAALLPPLARPSHCALGALRWVVGGENMTTPGGTRTPRKACQ